MHYKFPNINNPKTFSEKMQWAKVYGGLEKYANFVDKYEVRKIVKLLIGEQYLVPTFGAWDRFEDIDFDKLPNRFVLKGSHGSGYIYICKDKSKLNKSEVKKVVNSWLAENFYIRTREKQYDPCEPKIVSEEYLEDENGELIDYKFFYYNGIPDLVEVVWDRFTNHKGDIYMDMNWNKQNISYIGTKLSDRIPVKPDNFKEMVNISKKLALQFPFVRVDLYSLKGKIYFGELTFVPASGLERFDPPIIDTLWGNKIDLNKYKDTPSY
jgi:hypothetical protein